MPKEVRNPEIIIIQDFLSSGNFFGGEGREDALKRRPEVRRSVCNLLG